jgi:hypothetical protein
LSSAAKEDSDEQPGEPSESSAPDEVVIPRSEPQAASAASKDTDVDREFCDSVVQCYSAMTLFLKRKQELSGKVDPARLESLLREYDREKKHVRYLVGVLAGPDGGTAAAGRGASPTDARRLEYRPLAIAALIEAASYQQQDTVLKSLLRGACGGNLLTLWEKDLVGDVLQGTFLQARSELKQQFLNVLSQRPFPDGRKSPYLTDADARSALYESVTGGLLRCHPLLRLPFYRRAAYVLGALKALLVQYTAAREDPLQHMGHLMVGPLAKCKGAYICLVDHCLDMQAWRDAPVEHGEVAAPIPLELLPAANFFGKEILATIPAIQPPHMARYKTHKKRKTAESC